tara:strand:+ start:897 stop:2615 length:1719 start_codon:yes stop_codon:yes gene_type:complete
MIIFESVTWKNFLSTGNYPTTVQLKKGRTTLIVGDNGAGKSTILDALTFALFGKPFRRITKPRLINSVNEKDSVVEVVFKKGKNRYRVVRGQKPAIFEIYKNDVLVNQESKSKDDQSYLEKNILGMNLKSFTQVVILGSSSFVPFMQLSAADRRDVVEDLLDIKVFSQMNEKMKSRNSRLRRDLEDNTVDQKLAKEKIRIQKDYVDGLEKKSLSNIESHRGEIETTRSAVEKNNVEIANLKILEQKTRKEADRILKTAPDETRINNLHSRLSQKLLTEKSTHKFFCEEDSCPTCSQHIDHDFKSEKINKTESKITELQEAVDKLDEEKIVIRDAKRSAQKTVEAADEYEKLLIEKEKLVESNARYIEKMEELIRQIENQSSEISDEKEKLDTLRGELEKINTDREEILERANILSTLNDLLKDSGIKTKIIRHYLPTMNRLINKYLSDMDFFVNFTIDENFNEVIKSRHRDEFNYDNFSEGEKFRIDVALLLTWREIAKQKNSASTNLLILDEVFDGSLDNSGADDFMKLLQSLGGKSNVFVISHRTDTIVDKFSNVLKFEKKNNFSQIAKD